MNYNNNTIYIIPYVHRFTCFLMMQLILLGMLPKGKVQAQQHSVAREWNEVLLQSIREDLARPTVHARNLWHSSMAMYDAWAVYDTIASPYFLGNTIDGFNVPFNDIPIPADIEAAREEAISFAAYRILAHRFQNSPSAFSAINRFNALMEELGYDINNLGLDYESGDPAMLGNYIASNVINFGLQDGAREALGYDNEYYAPINPPLIVGLEGNPDMEDPNRWQPLTLNIFIDQSGNVIPLNTPEFLSPEWGNVTPFSMTEDDLTTYERNGNTYRVYHDPDTPPLLDVNNVGGLSEEYKWGFSLVAKWSSHLDPSDGVLWDISPASFGNIPDSNIPQTISDLRSFYNEAEGGDIGEGHPINPVTQEPYAPQMVARGDYTRVLAEFWADGPDSETPPGHWFHIMNEAVIDHPLFEKKHRGLYEVKNDLEWDVKAYFLLGGTMHDCAVASWGIKGWYDYPRPISAIRYMCELGQSSDSLLSNYHPGGIPLDSGYIEIIEAGDPLAGQGGQHIGKIKLYSWKGPDFISNPASDVAGVGWIRAEDWMPYQRPTFVSPNFAGYISGHSTFSRAAADVLTLLTGNAYFPGGMGEFEVDMNEFLVFEDGPSQSFTLQWATYRDASDQTSLSRIWGGIHPPADDIPGRLIGSTIAQDAFNLSERYFFRDADNDGFYSFEDCDDNNANIYPGNTEVCDGLDNNCNGLADDELPKNTYYRDADEDGFGDAQLPVDTCLSIAPVGYVSNDLDCNDEDATINPNGIEVCDGTDNNCNGLADDGLPKNTYYRDADEDGFGDAQIATDTCISTAPIGFVNNDLDCDDTNTMVNPNAMEIPYDELDNDCNVATPNDDLDEDGFLLAEDCNDENPNINPDAEEIANNGIDEDCDGEDLVTNVQHLANLSIQVFPNPFTDILAINCLGENCLFESRITIYDELGRVLLQQNILFKEGINQIDTQELSMGIYLIKIDNPKKHKSFTQKLIKM